MDCGCGNHHDYGNGCGCSGHGDWCCGGQGHGFQRRFQTKAEKIEMLKKYQAELETELTAVKEKIVQLNK